MGVVKFSLGTGSASMGLNDISHWDHLFPTEVTPWAFQEVLLSFTFCPSLQVSFSHSPSYKRVSPEATVPGINQREH